MGKKQHIKSRLICRILQNSFYALSLCSTARQRPGSLDNPRPAGPPTYPPQKLYKNEIEATINKLRLNKSPGFDLITGTVLKQLQDAGLQAITLLFNSILRTGHFPGQWKVSQIIPILKPGKPPEEVTSYRPISLLPVLSKLFEKLLVTRIKPLLHTKQIIPDHQFGFRRKHATTEQVHRIVNIIH